MNIKEAKECSAWLHWTLTNRCNLNCEYCSNLSVKNTGRISKINIPKLTESLDKTNRVYKIGFTGGGEPFLIPNLVEACRELTKKHYILLLTNLTLSKTKEFAKKINPEKVLNIIASAHIKELEKRGLLAVYIHNFLLLKQKGFSIETRAVAHPSLLKDAAKYRQLFEKKGIKLKFSPLSIHKNNKKHPYKYSKEEIETFDLKNSDYECRKDYYKPAGICNAGYNTAVVDPKGNIYICDSIKIKVGNIYDKINFRENLIICPLKFCRCPIHHYDSSLYRKALENKIEPDRIRPLTLYKSRSYEKIKSHIGRIGIFLEKNLFPY